MVAATGSNITHSANHSPLNTRVMAKKGEAGDWLVTTAFVHSLVLG